MDRVLFPEWKPDQPAYLSDGMVVADGCFPIANGYAPVGSFQTAPNGSLGAQCYGAAAYRTGDNTYSFAATLTTISRYTSAGYASLATGLANSLGVRFVPYSTLMLITNGADAIKKFTPTPTNTITDLGGSPPTARFIAVVGGFTVLGYASGSPVRVAWSNQGNPEQWAISTASEAGVYDMATGGDITGVVGGEYGLIFQENRIVRMTYTATDTVWQFDEIATDVGCIVPGSLATWGKLTFFLSNRGFMVCDGSTVTPIGDQKVDRWFLSLVDRSYFGMMSAVIDPTNSLYILTVPSASPANTVLFYSWTLSKWTTAHIQVERLVSGLAQSTSLEQISALYPNLDTMPLSLDSAVFRGGYPLLLVYDDQHRMGSLSGTPVSATFTDAQREFSNGRQTRLRGVRPLTDAAAPQITVAGCNALSDAPTPTTYASRRSSGIIRTRESWNLMQVSLAIPSQPWTFAQGFDYDAALGGRA